VGDEARAIELSDAAGITIGCFTNLAVQIQEVEREQANSDLNILNFDIFALTLAEFLERHQLSSRAVDGDSFCIEDKGLGRIFDTL
jgi:hypothetical protein